MLQTVYNDLRICIGCIQSTVIKSFISSDLEKDFYESNKSVCLYFQKLSTKNLSTALKIPIRLETLRET